MRRRFYPEDIENGAIFYAPNGYKGEVINSPRISGKNFIVRMTKKGMSTYTITMSIRSLRLSTYYMDPPEESYQIFN
jgi:hypothetical protein